MGSIRDYLPKKEELKNLQVKMPQKLLEQVQAAMKEDQLSWNELLTACFQDYLEQRPSLRDSERQEDNDKGSF